MDLVNHLNDRLLFAVPKKGRLHQSCLDLLKGSDVQFHRHSRLDIALCINLPIALIFLPAADIPRFVGEGRVDLGITGQDQVAECRTTEVEEILDLAFGKCLLQVQVPANGDIHDPVQLVGKNIVTSFTSLTRGFFETLEKEVQGKQSEGKSQVIGTTTIKYVGGSVEAACALGVADGIVDLVESGETMKAAGLKPIATVMTTSAVLIKSKHPSNPALVEIITSRIRGVITAQKYVLCTYNVPRASLEQVKKITPGRRAPTATQLEGTDDWLAISVMVLKKDIATVMDDLEQAGAKDIIVTNIANSRSSTAQLQVGRTPRAHAQAAAIWMVYAADTLFQRSREKQAYQGNAAHEGNDLQGKNWKGCNEERWKIWKERFLVLRGKYAGDEETRKLVEEAIAKMEGAERKK